MGSEAETSVCSLCSAMTTPNGWRAGRVLIYMEWSEETAPAMMSELDFEELIVILMLKNLGAALWEEGVIQQSPRGMSRSN